MRARDPCLGSLQLRGAQTHDNSEARIDIVESDGGCVWSALHERCDRHGRREE
jgi:hypothetical protein